jgi:hypothetical protein
MENKRNHIIVMVVVVVAIAGGAFYGGMQYGTAKTKAAQVASRGTGFGGGAGGARGGARGAMMGANGGAGDFAAGQIIAKDDTSVTIKNRTGSSQIVYFSPSTLIGKSVSGSAADLSAGQQITASGKNSPDGSLAAQDIQIRPAQTNQPAQ